MYSAPMSTKEEKDRSRLSIALSKEQRALVNNVRKKILGTSDETLKEIVWVGFIRELANRNWISTRSLQEMMPARHRPEPSFPPPDSREEATQQ